MPCIHLHVTNSSGFAWHALALAAQEQFTVEIEFVDNAGTLRGQLESVDTNRVVLTIAERSFDINTALIASVTIPC